MSFLGPKGALVAGVCQIGTASQYKFWKSKADYSYEETAAGGEEVKGSVWRNVFAFCIEL